MPPSFTTLASAIVRGPRCAYCARAARLFPATSPRAFPASSLSSFSSSSSSRAKDRSAYLSRSPLQTRLFSQSSHTPTAAPAQSHPDASASSSSSSSSTSSSSKPPSSVPSFYALFPKTLPLGPPPAGPFDINVRALRTEFLQLQAAAHPDFHHAAAASGAEAGGGQGHSTARVRAEALSSLINEAYRTLASPLLRAQYLLRQHGIDLAGDESTLGAGPDAQSDGELLMTVMETREEIEFAKTEDDLVPLREQNDARMRASEEALAAAFAADDLATAQREAVRLRYWVNINDALHNWEKGKDIILEH